jgi:2-desacetyl-2-hydroxyethyl bacteriochlorophyllide A dehydrogenase
MKAAYYTGNKKFLIRDNIMIHPKEGEVRLEVAYCGVCGTDLHIYHGHMDKRVAPPQIIGHEASGIVAEVGKGVKNVSPGDKVTVRPVFTGKEHPFDKGYPYVGKNMRFIGIDIQGAFQHSWTVPAYTLHKLPDSLPLKYGALIEPLAVGCHDVNRGRIKKGDYCVVIGGGPIGVLIAYVLREIGANILISEVNETRLKLLRSLDFETIDPNREDIQDRVSNFTNNAMADAVFEVSGSASAVKVMTNLVCARGKIIMVAVHGELREVDLFKFFWSELELYGARLYDSEDFEEAIRLAASAKIPFDKLISNIVPLEKIQDVFIEIDENPSGMKSLVACCNQYL